MRVVLIILPLMALSSLGLVALRSAPTESQPVGWLTDFRAAEALSKKTGRPLLIHFYADWCGPCRKMERQVLNDQAVLDDLSRRFVAVKVNADRHRELVKRFEIESLPADLLVDADLRILARSVGFTPLADYLAFVDRVDAEPGRQPHVILAKSRRVGSPGGSEEQQDTTGNDGSDSRQEPNLSGRTLPPPPANAGRPQIGLEGQCPVALRENGEWKDGNRKYAQRYQGMVYYLSSPAAFVRFSRNPSRYVPRLLGCDPVILAEKDQAVSGNIRFGAYYEGDLYLFATEDTRRRFQQNPARFTRSQHVLRTGPRNAVSWRN